MSQHTYVHSHRNKPKENVFKSGAAAIEKDNKKLEKEIEKKDKKIDQLKKDIKEIEKTK